MITKKCLKIRVLFRIIDNGEAIETVRNNNYDMVLMDVHLPGIKLQNKQIRDLILLLQLPITAISLDENRIFAILV
jgi:CheY-like chemotaxis protein